MAKPQLRLLEPDVHDVPHWAHEGLACTRCGGSAAEGRYHMVHASEPCSCDEAICICLAEGYAKCDACGALRTVWPREMVIQWTPVAVAELG